MRLLRAAGGRESFGGCGIGVGALLLAALLSAGPLRSASAENAASAASADAPAAPDANGTPQPSPAAPASAQSSPSGDASPQGSPQESAPAPSPASAPNAPSPAPASETAKPAAAVRSAEAAEPASTSVVINLIRLLVQEGALTQAKADALIRQAQDEAAAAARAQASGTAAPSEPTIGNAAAGVIASGESPAGVSPAAGSAATEAGSPTAKSAPLSVRVPYVPEIVKKQISEEVKEEVLQKAKAENWAAPNALPEWTKRFTLSGDFRFRNEWDLFDKRNSAFFTNFQAINSGSPFDVSDKNLNAHSPPLLDTTQDRDRLRIRARLGITADITDDFTAGLRLATGNTTNPVSTNQTLGTTLQNDSFVLDRAYLKYTPKPWLTLNVGRFANPWFFTDLVWDPDLNFDGVAVQYTPHPNGTVRPFLTAGVFPIENTPFNFPDNASKKQSRDKWLYGGQAGFELHPRSNYSLKTGLAYYYYSHIEGELSSPCVVDAATSASDPCDTDSSRPGFMQQGNTLFFIRNLALSDPANNPQFQFLGLASRFRELNATFQFDYAASERTHVIFDGDFVTNLAFNANAIAAKNPPNNRGASELGSTNPGPFAGGANGFQARMTVGQPELSRLWDWNFSVAYKYLESDAVVDAFTDSDFHLGGTNAKGYIVGGGLGIAKNVDLSARWLSASEITGAPYTVDVIQVDLNGRF